MRKAIQKEIIFIPLTIILVSMGLFLFAKTARADCYVLYSYTDPTFQRHPPIPCLSELPKGFTDNYGDSGYENYRFFKMSNCRCKTNPVGNDYYEFDKVCSFDVFYWPSNRTEKNVPLFYNQCSVCPPSQHAHHFGELILSCPTIFCNDYIPKSILTAPSDYISKRLGITVEEYFSRVASWKEASCVQTKGPELVKPYLEDDEYEETTYTTCTYTPCQVLPTCQEKCRKEHPLPEGLSGLSGRCLSNPDPENGFPKSLKQDGQYDDCFTGQSCYCYNTKPYVESVSLSVDPVYKEKFENYDDGKITEYDPLICESTIYDADKKDQAEGKVRVVILPQVNGTRITGALGAASCRFDSAAKRHKCTKKFKPEEIKITGGIRGKKLKCEVIPYDAYQEGGSRISNEFIVAQFNYYFVHLNPPEVTNYKEQYKLFTELSAIDDTVEYTGKPIYLKEKCILTKEDFKILELLGLQVETTRLDQLFSVGSVLVVLPKIDECIKRMGLKLDPKDPNKDRTIGMSDSFGTFRSIAIIRGTGVFISSSSGLKQPLAHELGHTYGLCDEYVWLGYLRSGYRYQRPCDNDYPACCSDSLENELVIEMLKNFRNNQSFGDWISSNLKRLSGLSADDLNKELSELRTQSPCAKKGGECFYKSKEEKIPKDYFLLKEAYVEIGTSYSFSFCPPQSVILQSEEVYNFGLFPYCVTNNKELIKKYGNRCFNTAEEIPTDGEVCAGMPLKEANNTFIEQPTDLTLPYRSIMGYPFWPVGIFRYPSKAKYPLNPK